MNLTTKQGAEKLKVSVGAFRDIVKRNPEKFDVIPTGNGTKKKHYLISNKSVMEFAKTYHNPRLQSAVTFKEPKANNSPIIVFKSLHDRMERIEKKLDALLGMWQ